jgi:hypothetical protein
MATLESNISAILNRYETDQNSAVQMYKTNSSSFKNVTLDNEKMTMLIKKLTTEYNNTDISRVKSICSSLIIALQSKFAETPRNMALDLTRFNDVDFTLYMQNVVGYTIFKQKDMAPLLEQIVDFQIPYTNELNAQQFARKYKRHLPRILDTVFIIVSDMELEDDRVVLQLKTFVEKTQIKLFIKMFEHRFPDK